MHHFALMLRRNLAFGCATTMEPRGCKYHPHHKLVARAWMPCWVVVFPVCCVLEVCMLLHVIVFFWWQNYFHKLDIDVYCDPMF